MRLALLPLLGFAAVLSWSAEVVAAPPGDALSWLNRLSGAARKLTYTGTFVYQNGSISETSRITHLVDGTNELERLEVLDGSPREVIRSNDEVKCFLPESHLLIVERRSQQRSFPAALLPSGLAELADYYVIRKGASGRIAGFDGQSIVLEPRDEFRYGHNFWVHSDSGLLLKATMIDERGKTLESFAFTQLQIGGPIDRQSLRSRFDPAQAATPAATWTIDRIQPQDARAEESQWLFRNPLPGFRRIAGMKRPARPGAPESTHLVFSDGLASISVFIEPLGERPQQPDMGMSTMGAVNIYSRTVSDHLVVVMGEVPAGSLKRVADGIELRKR